MQEMRKFILSNLVVSLVTSFMVVMPWSTLKAHIPFASERNGHTSVVPGTFTVFHTIKLGTHKDWKELKMALETAGCHIDSAVYDIVDKPAFTLASQESEVKLVVQSVADLGFEIGATYDEICARAKELGLELCPAEVGPQLRLQYKDDQVGEYYVIAMKLIPDSGGYPNLLGVGRYRHGRGPVLWAYYQKPDLYWDANMRFVFVLRE